MHQELLNFIAVNDSWQLDGRLVMSVIICNVLHERIDITKQLHAASVASM